MLKWAELRKLSWRNTKLGGAVARAWCGCGSETLVSDGSGADGSGLDGSGSDGSGSDGSCDIKDGEQKGELVRNG
jgi:hypothetical protein